MTVAIVGASETTELGRIPDLSQLQLHADAALNAMADAKIKPMISTALLQQEPLPPRSHIILGSSLVGLMAPRSVDARSCYTFGTQSLPSRRAIAVRC